MVELIIASRYNGPPGSANGGYTCGLLAEQVGEPAEVTLRSPPPLDTPMRFDGMKLWDGETLVAEAHRAHVHLEVPEPVAFDAAEQRVDAATPCSETSTSTRRAYVCGPGAATTGSGSSQAPIRRNECLRCPLGRPRRRLAPARLGRARLSLARSASAGTAAATGCSAAWPREVHDVPEPGDRCVVVAWPIGREGRKGYAGTALYRGDELLARARQTWIAPG